jgi:RND family efflux transporter MFP subunit
LLTGRAGLFFPALKGTMLPILFSARPALLALCLLITPAVLAQTPPPLTVAPASDIRVQIRARQHTVLAAEMAGKIIELPLREGERFKKGDRLAAFDCDAARARQSHAAAAAQAARRKAEVAGKLDKLSSISMLDVAEAESALTMAMAEQEITDVMVRRCVITAPFDGRVSEVKAQRYAYMPEGGELLAIYDASQFELEMIVPSTWLAWIKPGLGFDLRVDETGRDHAAEITRIAGAVDPVSQSVRVFGRIKGPTDNLLPGMSGSAHIAPSAATATGGGR